MSSKTHGRLIAWSLAIVATSTMAAPIGTSFTYQGELRVAGAPASTPHDFQFALFNVASGGAQISTLTQGDLPVNAGLFTTELDYTDVPFAASEEYWLEVRVRDGAASTGYTRLLPRQQITPAPYAINARTVQAGGVTQAAIAAGAVGSTQMAENAVGTAQILNGAVSLADMAAQSVGSGQLRDAAVFPQHLVAGAVSGDKIASDAIEARHIMTNAITSAEIAQGTIIAADMATNAVISSTIMDGSIGGIDVEPNTLNGSHIQAASLTGNHIVLGSLDGAALIQNATITGLDIASDTLNGGHIQNGSLAGIDIAANGIGSSHIIDGAIGRTKLAFAAVGRTNIEAGAVGPFEIDAGAVRSSHIGVNQVTSTHIFTGSVGEAQLAFEAVGSSRIQPGAVTAAKIADATITPAKLAFTPGDITAVNTSIGLTGGAATGDVSLGVDFAAVQSRITGTCSVGEYFRGIDADGSVACEPLPGVPSISTVHDTADEVGRYAAIAIGNDGLPVIAYANTTAGALMVAKCRNSACTGAATITVVDDPVNTVGAYADIAIGSDGRPVISYQDATTHELKVATCSNPACTGAAAIQTISTPSFQFGADTSIAIAGDGFAVISARDETNLALKVVKCTSENCATSTVATAEDSPTNSVGFASSIAIGSDGLPVISHYDLTAQALKVAKCANPNCTAGVTPTSVDDSTSNVGDYSSIAIGSDGFPVISYFDASAGSLKLAKCISLNCSGATLVTLDDPANTVGQYSSVAIGGDGIPVVSHYDPIAGALKLTRCGNGACAGAAVTTTVDDPANRVGRHTSIAIGADGLPVIAYFDVTAGSLKVAKCGTRSCQ